jgi:hypothetical protein
VLSNDNVLCCVKKGSIHMQFEQMSHCCSFRHCIVLWIENGMCHFRTRIKPINTPDNYLTILLLSSKVFSKQTFTSHTAIIMWLCTTQITPWHYIPSQTLHLHTWLYGTSMNLNSTMNACDPQTIQWKLSPIQKYGLKSKLKGKTTNLTKMLCNILLA